MHSELVYAECLLLRSILTFIQDENLVSFIKGGLKIRSCYQSYKECLRIYRRRDWKVGAAFGASGAAAGASGVTSEPSGVASEGSGVTSDVTSGVASEGSGAVCEGFGSLSEYSRASSEGCDDASDKLYGSNSYANSNVNSNANAALKMHFDRQVSFTLGPWIL